MAELEAESLSCVYQESEWPMIRGYFVSAMDYFMIIWPILFSQLALEVDPTDSIDTKSTLTREALRRQRVVRRCTISVRPSDP